MSNQAENFGPAERVSLFRCSLATCKHFWVSSGMWALPSLEDVCLIPCIVQIFLQVAGMLQINLLILQNHQPLVILFSSFVNATSALTASCCSQIFTVTSSFQTASSSLSKCCITFLQEKERLLEMITRWLHYRTGFHNSAFPDLQTISHGPLVCNIFGLNCISATKCYFHIFNFLLSMLQYNSTPFKFIVQRSRWGLNGI